MASGQGGFDEGIDNLQRFVAQLAETLTEVHADRGRLSLHAEALQRLRDEVGEHLQELEDELHRQAATVTAAHRAAVDELEQAGQLAVAATDQRLSAAEDRIGGLKDELEEELSAAARRLEQGASTLVASGIDPSSSTAQALAADLHEQQGDLERALAGLQEAVDRARQAVEDAEGVGEDALSGLAAEAAAQHREAEAVGGLAVYGSEEFVAELRGAIEGAVQALATSYAGWAEESEQAAEALSVDVARLLSERADESEEEAKELLEAESASVEGEALMDVLREAAPVLDFGVAVAERTAALVPELNRGNRLVAEIDRLLDELR